MKPRRVSLVACLTATVVAVILSSPAALSQSATYGPQGKGASTCGGVGQAKCTDKPATFMAAAVGTCPTGSFFDIGKWQCYTCPSGYNRTLEPVDGDHACSKADPTVKLQQLPATFAGRLCPAPTFYDPIHGGQCYRCPAGTRRSAASVEASNACFEPAHEDLTDATKRKSSATAFGCSAGTFWDGWNGGACWTCPSGYNRTGYPISGDKACSKAIPEKTSKATLVQEAKCADGEIRDAKIPGTQDAAAGGGCWTCRPDSYRTIFPIDGSSACEVRAGVKLAPTTMTKALTCPAGQIFDLTGLTAEEIASRPETQGRSVRPVTSGTCWACPVNYDRGLPSVKSAAACRVSSIIDWRAPRFKEPGLFGLEGASEVLADLQTNRPSIITAAVNATVKRALGGLSVTDPSYAIRESNLKAKEIQRLTDDPGNSTAASAAIFARLLVVLVEPSKATPAEKLLAASFKKYVVTRRVFVAQNTLDAYDAWDAVTGYSANGYRFGKDGPEHNSPDLSGVAMLTTLGANAAGEAFNIAAGGMPIFGDVIASLIKQGADGFAVFQDPGQATKEVVLTPAQTALSLVVSGVPATFAGAGQDAAVLAAFGKGAQAAVATTTRLVATAIVEAGGDLVLAALVTLVQLEIDRVMEIREARTKLVAAVGTANASDPGRMALTTKGVVELVGLWAHATSEPSRRPAR